MSSRRQRIAALRAKAASTTFPAEAEALRAKADELEGKEPAPQTRADAADHILNIFGVRPGEAFSTMGGIRITGAWFSGASNYTIHLRNRDEDPPDESEGRWMTVTDIHGRTHRERIW